MSNSPSSDIVLPSEAECAWKRPYPSRCFPAYVLPGIERCTIRSRRFCDLWDCRASSHRKGILRSRDSWPITSGSPPVASISFSDRNLHEILRNSLAAFAGLDPSPARDGGGCSCRNGPSVRGAVLPVLPATSLFDGSQISHFGGFHNLNRSSMYWKWGRAVCLSMGYKSPVRVSTGSLGERPPLTSTAMMPNHFSSQ